MKAPREFTIKEAKDRMRAGELTARALVESCLERICKREETLHAWVEVYNDEALEAADRCDQAVQNGNWLGELHGIPMGVKDIIDVKGMWTRAGCKVYPASIAASDAPLIQSLRDEGAIFLGKTETTAFANNDPTITRNPWNPDHTPGGSSSGSGAAVADRMCLAALGSQTGGSLIRPAAYNGITGFKPTYGWVNMNKVIPVSWGLDNVGPHARTLEDAALICRILRRNITVPFLPMPVCDISEIPDFTNRKPRFGFLGEFLPAETSPDYIRHLSDVREAFEKAGAEVVDLKPPPSFEIVAPSHRALFDTEMAYYHRDLFETRKDDYPPGVRERIEAGKTVSGCEYVEAVRQRRMFQEDMIETLSTVDAAFMNASVTTAPFSLASTGSPAANVPWSFTGFPALSLPSGLDSNGLPFGVQVVGLPGGDDHLAAVGAWCEAVLDFSHSPAD